MIKITNLDSDKSNLLHGSRTELAIYIASFYLPYQEYIKILEDLTDSPVKDNFKTYAILCEEIAKEIVSRMNEFYENDWFDYDYLSEVDCGYSKRLRIEIV